MKSGPLCILACQWCNLPEFWRWAGVADTAGAKRFILQTCAVASRKCLDDGGVAAFKFKTMVRQPFMASQGVRA